MTEDEQLGLVPVKSADTQIAEVIGAKDWEKIKESKLFSRIVGFRMENPQQLLANPWNFRNHSKKQRDIVEGTLEEVGWITCIIENIRTGHIVDGHLRAKIAVEREEPAVPVIEVDLSPEEEKLALLMFDQSGALATIDYPTLASAGVDIEAENEKVQSFLDELMAKAVIVNTEIPEDAYDDLDPMEEVSFTVNCIYKDVKDFKPILSKWIQRATVNIEYNF